MKPFHAAFLALGLMTTMPATATPLEPLRWQKRVLLVFAAAGDARWDTQRAELAGEGAVERDLVLLHVPNSGAVNLDGVGTADASALRRAFGVREEDGAFTALLVGKDGGVKRRASEPIPAAEIFATIDAMPMRANEMRRTAD